MKVKCVEVRIRLEGSQLEQFMEHVEDLMDSGSFYIYQVEVGEELEVLEEEEETNSSN